jgi:hypothetical protein
MEGTSLCLKDLYFLVRGSCATPGLGSLEEAVMWARRLKIAHFFIFWLNRAKFDRACECPANGPAWSSMVPHVQHTGRCGNLLEFAGPLLDHAGHLQEFVGHCGTGGRLWW